ncbi:hypothetical protein [Blastomonas sp.]|uniref:hypothetical protein n=1 Tax=Blastomonas sp. TaxID=1909299 RepID=UPI00406A3958|nr:hypothetical protein [Blastomonas sp.]
MDDRHGKVCLCGRHHHGGDGHRAEGSLDRRTVMAALVTLPALGTSPAWAQDLLDPTRLRSSRVGTEALATRSNRPPGWLGPEYARDMASSVTSAILSLVRAYGATADQIGKLQAEEKQLTDKLNEAIRNKEAILDEYRQGLFCSGCGRTKSDIISKGEQFPHSGQTIIKPTPEQIAAKERELQQGIDRLAQQLRDAKAKLAKLSPDIDAIRSQLFEGMGLWRTATSMERGIIRQEFAFDAQDYVQQRTVISRQIDTVIREAAAAQTIPAFQACIADARTWSDALAKCEDRHADDRGRMMTGLTNNDNSAQRQTASVQSTANEVASKITAFGLAGYLNILTTLMGRGSDGTSIAGAGYTFRMGKYDAAGFGEILPRVAEFISRASSLVIGTAPGYNMPASQELAKLDRALAQVEPKLAAALELRRQQEAAAALERQQEEARRQAEAQAREQQLGNTPGSGS